MDYLPRRKQLFSVIFSYFARTFVKIYVPLGIPHPTKSQKLTENRYKRKIFTQRKTVEHTLKHFTEQFEI